MPIKIIDNFKLDSKIPLDGRIIATNSTDRDSIKYKYDGMKVFQLDTRNTYIWNLYGYTSSGVTSSSWDVIKTSIIGQGDFNYASKWDSSGYGLTNSSIISLPIAFNEDIQKVGIGSIPKEAFQVDGNYSTAAIGTSSMPFVVHKGTSTVIGENWYYDITLSEDRVFDSGFPSSSISFKDGGITIKGRTANSGYTMNDLLEINNDGSISFIGASSSPSASNDGSVYFNGDRVKVKENDKWKNVSNTYDVYTTILTQVDDYDPTETLLETTIGTGTWSYGGTGIYLLTIDNGFDGETPRISGFCGPYTSTGVYFGEKINDSVYKIRTSISSIYSTDLSDSMLYETVIEIKVWNI